MKIYLQRTYTYEIGDLEAEFDEALMGGYGIFWREGLWEAAVARGEEKGDWEGAKKEAEEQFYANYPKDVVGVSFPPSTVDDLAKLYAYDLHEGELDVADLCADNPKNEWHVSDDKETREVEMEFE